MILNTDPFNYLLKRYDAEILVLIRKYSTALSADELPDDHIVRLHNMLISALNESYNILDKTMKEFTEVINYAG